MKNAHLASSLALVVALSLGAAARADTPDHFFNAKENVNPDPNYTPGEFPPVDAFAARQAYYGEKATLADADDSGTKTTRVSTLGIGQLTFSAPKNETKSVLGYFREYYGVAELGRSGFKKVTLLIDVNSLDTAVPGRNYRILNLFFESMNAKFGAAKITLDKFKVSARQFSAMKRGKATEFTASGNIILNGQTRPLTAKMSAHRKNGTWIVESAQDALVLTISDFAFGDRVYKLMKSCNHKSMGNKVPINFRFMLR